MSAYAKALDEASELAEEFPDNMEYRATRTVAIGNLATVTSDKTESLRLRKEFVALQRELMKLEPDDPRWKSNLAIGLTNLALALEEGFIGSNPEAGPLYDEAYQLREQLAIEYPGRPDYQNSLASSIADRGSVLWLRGKLTEAEQCFREAVEKQQLLVSRVPGIPSYSADLARFCEYLGEFLSEQGRIEESANAFGEGLSVRIELVVEHPEATQNFDRLAVSFERFTELVTEATESESSKQRLDELLSSCFSNQERGILAGGRSLV